MAEELEINVSSSEWETETDSSESYVELSDDDGVKSESPVMKMSEMSQKQIRRLTISPTFKRKLSELYEAKAEEQKKMDKKKIPDPPPPPPKDKTNPSPSPSKSPNPKPKPNPPKPEPKPNPSKPTKPSDKKKKVKVRKTHFGENDGGAPDLDLEDPPYFDRAQLDKLLPPGFNIKSSLFGNSNLQNNPLFYNMGSSNNNRKSLPVSQWPIRYAGNDNGIGLNLFLRRVEFFAHSERMNKEDLFESAHLLLVGPAQDWFVTKWPELRDKDWDYFIRALRNQFLPKNIDHYIKIKSFSMYQSKNETFSNFLVRMEQFFLCRTTPLSDADKFDVIWHTMRSYYRDRLALMEVKELKNLEDLCGRIDNSNEGLMNRVVQSFENQKIYEITAEEPPKISKIKEPNERSKNQQNQNGKNNQNQTLSETYDQKNNYTVTPSSSRNNQTQQNSNRNNQNNQNQNRNSQYNQNNQSIQYNQNNQNNFRNNEQQNYQQQNNQQQNYQNSNRNQNTNNYRRGHEEWYPDNGWRSLNRDQILQYYKPPDGRICLNCRKFGHHFTICYARRNVFCSICGLPEFHYEECPFCEGKNRRREN